MRPPLDSMPRAGLPSGRSDAQIGALQVLAWGTLYRHAPSQEVMARTLVRQLDGEPALKATHLALYVLCVQRLLGLALRRRRRLLVTHWLRQAFGAASLRLRVPRSAGTAAQRGCDAGPVGPLWAPAAASAAGPAADPAAVQRMEDSLLAAAPPADGTAEDPRSTRRKELERRLQTAKQLLLRDLEQRMRGGPCITSPDDVREWLCLHCAGLEHEVLIVLFLDAHHRLIAAERMFRGTLTETAVHPREIVKAALQHNAAAVALAHNHPSAALDASAADRLVTQRVRSALELVQVRVLDHFIVGGSAIVSMAQRGWM